MARRSVGDDPHTQRPALFLHHQAYRPPHAGIAARLGRRLRKPRRGLHGREPGDGRLPAAFSAGRPPAPQADHLRPAARAARHRTIPRPRNRRGFRRGRIGNEARPCNYDWILSIRRQCVAATSPSLSTKPVHGLSRTGAFTASAARTSIRRPARPGSTTRQSDEVSPPIRPARVPASGPCFPTSRSRPSSQGHSRASFPTGTVPACGNSLPYQPRNLPRESPLPDTSPDTSESLSPVSCLSIAPPGIASPQ